MSTQRDPSSSEPLPEEGGFTWRQGENGAQLLPVNLFRTEHGVMVVAPMPGMEAASIGIEVTETRLALQADLRGPGQDRRDYLRREWRYGRYHRSIELPFPVDAGRANASYDNGILTIELPAVDRTRPGQIKLRKTGTARAVQAAHSGLELQGPGRSEQ